MSEIVQRAAPEGRGVSLLVAIAVRDACRATIILARLAEGSATNAELRRAAGYPGDSFRSLLRRMERHGLIVAIPGLHRRWALAVPCSRDEEHEQWHELTLPAQIDARAVNLPTQ